MAGNKKETSLWLLYGMAALVFALWICWFFVSDWIIKTNFNFEKAGQLGDIFGGINALFSGLAFAALIFTVHLQRKELSLQRAELTATREVLGKQEQQMKQQNETLRKQNFESTFFQWLNLHHEIVNALMYKNYSGRKLFAFLRIALAREYDSKIAGACADLPEANSSQGIPHLSYASAYFQKNPGFDNLVLKLIYKDFYKNYDNELVHYYQNLFGLLGVC